MNKKILLVDDQREVLEGIRQFLLSIQIPQANILLAGDGRQGLETALREKPDVIVADIMMPEMDGLSMIQGLHASGLDSRIIVLSAYSEFDFAKQAISLGVSDYLVKPVTQQQVCTAVMRQLSRPHNAPSHDLFCGLMLSSYLAGNDFYTRPEDVMNITGLSRFAGRMWRLALVDTPALTEERAASRFADRAVGALKSVGLDGSIFRMYAGPLLAVINAGDFQRIKEGTELFVRELSAPDGGLSGGFSGVGEGAETLPELYRQARGALNAAKERGGWCIEEEVAGSDRLVPAREMEALALGISAGGDDGEVWRRLDEILARLTLMDADPEDKCISLQKAMRALCERFGEPDLLPAFRYEDRRSLFSLKQQSIEVVRKLLSRESLPQSFVQIRKAVDYINRNFASDCSVTYLANYVNFSYSYFSATFTRAMGMSASEYVLSVRLENAERMLRSPGAREPISVIAAKCGFENPRYFSTCFKNRYGKSPSEY